jgi:hypothetical protein
MDCKAGIPVVRGKGSHRKEKPDDEKLNPKVCSYCGALRKHCRCCGSEANLFGDRDQEEEAAYQQRLAEACRLHDEVCSCNKKK